MCWTRQPCMLPYIPACCQTLQQGVFWPKSIRSASTEARWTRLYSKLWDVAGLTITPWDASKTLFPFLCGVKQDIFWKIRDTDLRISNNYHVLRWLDTFKMLNPWIMDGEKNTWPSMYWTLHMANVGVLGGFTLFSCGFLECASSPGLMSLRALRMWRPSSPSLQIPFLKNFTPKSSRYNGEKLQKGCRLGNLFFFQETPQNMAKNFRTQIHQPSENNCRCIALLTKRRSTGVWNEGWCKVGGITQRVFWMLKALGSL